MYVPGAHTGQKNVRHPREQELQRSCVTMWMLGIEPTSSGRAASALLTTEPSLRAHRQCFL